jgi:hypothetical protein
MLSATNALAYFVKEKEHGRRFKKFYNIGCRSPRKQNCFLKRVLAAAAVTATTVTTATRLRRPPMFLTASEASRTRPNSFVKPQEVSSVRNLQGVRIIFV